MGLLLILAQVTLVVLDYGSHTVSLSPWIVFLPAILFATTHLVGRLVAPKLTFMIDRIWPPFG